MVTQTKVDYDKVLDDMVKDVGLKDTRAIEEAKKYVKNLTETGDLDPSVIETDLLAFYDGYRLARGIAY